MEQAESKKNPAILLFFILCLFLSCLACITIIRLDPVYDCRETPLSTVGVFLFAFSFCWIYKKSGQIHLDEPLYRIITRNCDTRYAVTGRGLAVL